MARLVPIVCASGLMFLSSSVSAQDLNVARYPAMTSIAIPLEAVESRRSKGSITLDFAAEIPTAILDQIQGVQSVFTAGFEETGRIVFDLECDCATRTLISPEKTVLQIISKGLVSAETVPYEFREIRQTKERPRRFGSHSLVYPPSPKSRPDTAPKQGMRPMPVLQIGAIAEAGQFDVVDQRLLDQLRSLSGSSTKNAESRPSADAPTQAQIAFRSEAVLQRRALPEIEQSAQALTTNCVPYRVFVPENWPDSKEAQAIIADIRRSMGVLDGDPDISVMVELAQAHLGLGMGAEARRALELTDLTEDVKQALLGLSQKLDGEEVAVDVPAHIANACEEVAIWAVLDGAMRSPTDINVARSQFARAPYGVKVAIGARLAARFLDAGDEDAAHFVLSHIKGAPEQKSGDYALVASRLADQSGLEDEAEQLLQDAIAADADQAPNALLELVGETLSAGAPNSAKVQEKLVVYQEELKGTPSEAGLLAAQIHSLINTSDYTEALTLLEQYETLARNTQTDMLIDKLADAILNDDSDAAFLMASMGMPNPYYRRVSSAIQQDIQDRFEALGLGHLAANLGAFSSPVIKSPAQVPVAESEGQSEPTGAANTAVVALLAQSEGQASVDQAASQEITSIEVQTAETANAVEERTTGQPVSQPLATAVSQTTRVLDQLDSLKSDLEALGL